MRFLGSVLLLMVWPVALACAAPVEPPKTPSRNVAPPATPAPVSRQAASINGVTQTAANAGVRVCLPTVEKISNFVIANTRSRAYVFLPPTDADRQMTSASFEVELSNKSIAYATMSTAPTRDGSCDALYETVTYWDAPCADVAAKGFPQAKLTGALQQQILVLQGGPQLRIFLMPAGTQGCVAIKKEVVY